MKYIFIFILFMSAIKVQGQINLVLNPSFEQYSNCPDNLDEVTYANYWNMLDSSWRAPDWAHDPNGVPEYCNVCASLSSEVNVPWGADYYHYARTGDGMMQLVMYYDLHDFGPYDRDYLQGHLTHTLDSGHRYFVSFYTVLEDYIYGINHIGAYFDDGAIDTTSHPYWVQSQYTAQIVDTNIITDTFNWTKIQGTFIATGTERLITIGNFYGLANTQIIALRDTTGCAAGGGCISWYLIDDVSVIDCNNQPNAGDDTTIHPGDSVFLGTNEILIPYTWYVMGNPTPVDSGGGFWAKPTVTTTYVVRQDNICGEGYRYDTVVVHVWPDTLVNATPIFNVNKVSVYPNPVSESVTVVGAKGCKFAIYNLIGQEVFSAVVNSDKESFDISGVPNGVYFVHVVDAVTGFVVVRKILKE